MLRRYTAEKMDAHFRGSGGYMSANATDYYFTSTFAGNVLTYVATGVSATSPAQVITPALRLMQ